MYVVALGIGGKHLINPPPAEPADAPTILSFASTSTFTHTFYTHMGRTKPKKQAITKATEAASKSDIPKQPSIPALLEKAQSLIVQCDYELAIRFIQRILEQQPSHAEAKELLGVVQLEMGDVDAAKQVWINYYAIEAFY